MDKYPIRLVGEPYVPRELDLDMEPPEWHTPWFEADALDADGHHHRVYWPIPNKTNEWLVGHLLTVDDPDFGDVCGKYPAARIASVEIATLASITSSHPASPCAATASRASVGQ